MCCLSTEQSKTLFVRGLSEDTTEETLRESFEGSISARIVTDRDTGSSKGYVKHNLGLLQLLQERHVCVVQVLSNAYVGDSYKAVDGVELEGRPIALVGHTHFSMSSFLPTYPWQPMDSHEKDINSSVVARSQPGYTSVVINHLLFYK